MDPTLNARRDIFERVRSLWAQKQGIWCALDFEAWDRDHTLLTEFGWSIVRWDGETKVEEQGHLTVKEHRYYTNTFVEDNREVILLSLSRILCHSKLCSIIRLGPAKKLTKPRLNGESKSS